MSKYTVRKVKTFAGHEGQGFNAELISDGIPVAFVIDEGNGGEPRFDWYDRERVRSEFADTAGGKTLARMIPKEEAVLRGHIKGQTRTAYGETFPLTMDVFVAELVGEHLMLVAMKRKCKTSTCYRLAGQAPGEYMQMKAIYSNGLGDRLRAKYGDKLECVHNEKFGEG